MSCELKPHAKIKDLDKLHGVLLSYGQDDAKWLDSRTIHAISPNAQTIVLASAYQFVVLELQYDQNYQVAWHAEMSEHFGRISAVACFPIARWTDRDWTCVALGTEEGWVRFYTDSGQEIFSQRWHDRRVVGLRAQSGEHKNDELHIVYGSCVCVVQGSQLVQVLRNAREHSERNSARSSSDAAPLEFVPCRKWNFEIGNVKNAVVVGPRNTCAFDHLLTASMEGGFYASYKSAPPQTSLTISVTDRAFVAFNFAKEGFTQPVLADVARAVASKIKSSLPNWLTGSAPAAPDAPPAQPIAEWMTLRYGLFDEQRIGLSIWLSPDHQHVAVADSLGRVILVDCCKATAVRVWKGYREAQCAFVQINERIRHKKPDEVPRKALFLVIYAPRRSCLEVWTMTRGPKVGAFSVSRMGRLIANEYSLMGDKRSSAKNPESMCVFLDDSGEMKQLVIPFHCALSDENSGTAKDLHLLKQIKVCLRNIPQSNAKVDASADVCGRVSVACASFQTDEIRLKCVEMLVRNSNIQPSVLVEALNKLLGNATTQGSDNPSVQSENELTDESFADLTPAQALRRQFCLTAENYLGLVEFYIYLIDARTEVSKSNEPVRLNLSETELENVQRFVDLKMLEQASRHGANTARVTFNEAAKSTEFTDYLAIFDCSGISGASTDPKDEDEEDDVDQEQSGVRLKAKRSKMFAAVGHQMFGAFIDRGKGLSEFVDRALASRLSSADLMRLFVLYWLDRPFDYTNSADLIVDLSRFTAVLQHICVLAGDSIKYEYNAINYWWQSVREILLQSSKSLQSLLAAMMCRTYAARFHKRDSSIEDCVEACEDIWEQVPQESAEWSLLIDKLDDVAALSAVMGSTLSQSLEQSTLPAMRFDTPDTSLGNIVNSGKGIVSELTAKWIISYGIDPGVLLEKPDNSTNDDPTQPMETEQDPTSAILSEKSISAFDSHWRFLREHFPFSLHSGVILAHMTWEYFCHWSKQMSNMNLFKAALKCLATIMPADFALKHGICCMIWNAHLIIPLEATKKLINKTGRLPKEALCMQDIGLSDSLVGDFLENCNEFLEQYATSGNAPKVDLRYEELLQDGPIPLALLALEQREAVPEIVRVHSELNQVMFMIAALNLRVPKPIQMVFDAMTNQTFFTDINRPLKHELPVADPVLLRKRTEFLAVVITATMDLIREDLEHVFLDDHILWMERVERLSNAWGLNNDELKRHQIVELYAHCWDEYAEEQLNSVLDNCSLGGLLLRIAGRRLSLYTKNKPRLYAEVASVGPLVTDYLDTLHNSSDRLDHRGNTDISLERLIALAVKAFQCLADTDSREKRIAAQVFDACQRLKEIQMT